MNESRRVGLLGYPVHHSLSPVMHNAAFHALGLAWEYDLIPVAPENLALAVDVLQAEGYVGANVTIPHKQAIMPLLAGVSQEAQIIGAVNTIINASGQLRGYNTDAYGFWQVLGDAAFTPSSYQAVVLGAGGAARAVLYALLSHGFSVTLVNRTESKATELAQHFAPYFDHTIKVVAHDDTEHLQAELEIADLLVNSTSVGMTPHITENPLPPAISLPATLTVYDLVYNPRETALLQAARAAGAKTVDGLGMLLYQGVEAFRLWTHQEPPVDVMRTALEGAIQARTSSPP